MSGETGIPTEVYALVAKIGLTNPMEISKIAYDVLSVFNPSSTAFTTIKRIIIGEHPEIPDSEIERFGSYLAYGIQAAYRQFGQTMARVSLCNGLFLKDGTPHPTGISYGAEDDILQIDIKKIGQILSERNNIFSTGHISGESYELVMKSLGYEECLHANQRKNTGPTPASILAERYQNFLAYTKANSIQLGDQNWYELDPYEIDARPHILEFCRQEKDKMAARQQTAILTKKELQLKSAPPRSDNWNRE